MRTGTSLTTTAVGAILAFAITATPSWVNLHVVGWILMLTGICGLVLPRRGRGWLRRTVLVKGSPDFTETPVDQDQTPAITGTVLSDDEAAPRTNGPVERESIVEYTER